jgi:hypothetical protein
MSRPLNADRGRELVVRHRPLEAIVAPLLAVRVLREQFAVLHKMHYPEDALSSAAPSSRQPTYSVAFYRKAMRGQLLMSRRTHGLWASFVD